MAEEIGRILLQIVVILLAAKFGGWLCHKINQSAVLGELLVGAILGPSLFNLIVPGQNPVLTFIAEIGVIVLLFQVGLESNIYQLLKVGISSVLVAIVGVAVPFLLGFLYFFYFNGSASTVAIFVGATLTATSVGVTMRVFADLNKIKSEEGKIILGAAVIDDVIGLIILSVLAGIVQIGRVSILHIGQITFYSIAFLALTAFLGIKLAPYILNLIKKLQIQRTFIISAFVFALAAAYIADLIGLATIVGAFAAGLVLETTSEKEKIREKLKPIADLFVPVFFVMAGAYFDFKAFFQPGIILIIIILSIIACAGKIVAGIGVIKSKAKRLIVGVGMIPRGEVGLIFAAFGLTNNIISSSIYSALVVVVMLTTFITPPILTRMIESQ